MHAHTNHCRHSFHALIRRRRFILSPHARFGAAEATHGDPEGKANRPEAGPPLVLAVGRVAPRRGVCEGAPAAAGTSPGGCATVDPRLGLATAPLLPARSGAAAGGAGAPAPAEA